MKVWVALGDCGDYYCDNEHPLGIYSTEQKAADRVSTYQEAVNWDRRRRGHFAIEIDEHNSDYPQGLDKLNGQK